MTGQSLLAAYSGGDVESRTDPPILYALDCAITHEIFTTPDPEVEGGMLVACLAVEAGSWDMKPAFDSYRFSATKKVLMNEVERVASTLDSAPRVRGAIAILQPDYSLSCLYWDGKQWINAVFYDWWPVGELKQHHP